MMETSHLRELNNLSHTRRGKTQNNRTLGNSRECY
jgi:hypothetical protein